MSGLIWALVRHLVAAVGPRTWHALSLVLPGVTSLWLGWTFAQPIAPCVGVCDEMAQIDGVLQRIAPELVVIGNSMARHAVDLPQLAAGLGIDPERAAMVTVPRSSPGTWYAVARYRMFEQGHRPTQLVLVAPSRSFWITNPVAGSDVAAQVSAAGTEDPVLQRVMGVTPGPSQWWFRAELRRRMWRATTVRTALGTVAMAFALSGLPLTEQVDDEAAANPTGVKNRFGGAARTGEVGFADSVEASFVPELVSLAGHWGAEITFARIPARGRDSSDFLEARPEGDAALAAFLAERGVSYHALPDLVLKDQMYADAFHLRPEGATSYTAALVEAMTRAPSVATPRAGDR